LLETSVDVQPILARPRPPVDWISTGSRTGGFQIGDWDLGQMLASPSDSTAKLQTVTPKMAIEARASVDRPNVFSLNAIAITPSHNAGPLHAMTMPAGQRRADQTGDAIEPGHNQQADVGPRRVGLSPLRPRGI
jgi:hypothetical protein